MIVHNKKTKFLNLDIKNFKLLKFLNVLILVLVLSLTCDFIYKINSKEGMLEDRVKEIIHRYIIDTISFGRYVYNKPKQIINSLRFSSYKFKIYLKDEDFSKLQLFRSIAINKNMLTEDLKKRINADLNFENLKLNAKIRLKGDTVSEHQDQSKWSINIRLIDGEIFETSEFALQHPKRRSFIISKLQLIWAEELGLPVNKIEMVELYINDNYMGVYQFEEKWKTSTISRELDANSVIVKFEDNAYLKERPSEPYLIKEAYKKSIPIIVDSKNITKNEILKKNARRALKLLRGFQNGDLPADKVFDVEKMGIWFALGDVFGTWHGYSWVNVHFGYDPKKDKLVPLLWDMSNENHIATPHNRFSKRLIRLTDEYMDPNSPFWNEILSNEIILNSYMNALNSLTDEKVITPIWNKSQLKIKNYLETLQVDYPQINLDTDVSKIISNIDYIKKNITQPKDPIYAFIDFSNNNKILKVYNRKQVSIRVIGLFDEKNNIIYYPKSTEIILEKTPFNKTMDEQIVNLDQFNGIDGLKINKSNFSIIVSLMGIEREIIVPLKRQGF